MYHFHWNSTTISTNQQANDMVKVFAKVNPIVGAFDTEDTGLHIKAARPFVYQFGFVDLKTMEGYTYAVDIERQPKLAHAVIDAWQTYMAPKLQVYLGHNTSFDIHMMDNYGLPYRCSNLSDTMFYIRLAHDALKPENGGPPLKLKLYAQAYIDREARYHEKILDQEKTAIVKDLNLKLKNRLAGLKPPEEYKSRTYTLKVIQEIFSDPIADYTDLPADAQKQYLKWLYEDVPEQMRPKITSIAKADDVPYNILNRENLLKYAHYDIVFPLEIWYNLNPVIKARHNERGLQIENALLYPLVDMEAHGFAVDKKYLEQSRVAVKQYIIEQRQKFYELAGEKVKVSQHERIKELFMLRFGLKLKKTNSLEIDTLKANLIHQGGNDQAVRFIQLLQELRTLEKWYSTYIIRFLNELKLDDRLYTSINDVGAVSGRVTCDFQQFPKKGINKEDGSPLFNPRHIIKVDGGHKKAMVFADFSQIELRLQALYTILVGHADLNMCRAYMPYKCHQLNGHKFDYKNPADISNWKGEWYLDEMPDQRWTPTDLHGKTTELATGLHPGDPEFKAARSKIGKRVNFAKNYGAQLNRIKIMFPEKTDEEQRRINDSYYKAFPGVKFYHQYCNDRAATTAHTANMFGINYYNVPGHNLINMLIQGSAAYWLKIKEIKIAQYIKDHNLYSRWQLPIHDELMWAYDDRDDPSVIWEFKRIMEDWPDGYIPLVAEVDCSVTSWDEKKGMDTLEDLQTYLSH